MVEVVIVEAAVFGELPSIVEVEAAAEVVFAGPANQVSSMATKTCMSAAATLLEFIEKKLNGKL